MHNVSDNSDKLARATQYVATLIAISNFILVQTCTEFHILSSRTSLVETEKQKFSMKDMKEKFFFSKSI